MRMHLQLSHLNGEAGIAGRHPAGTALQPLLSQPLILIAQLCGWKSAHSLPQSFYVTTFIAIGRETGIYVV